MVTTLKNPHGLDFKAMFRTPDALINFTKSHQKKHEFYYRKHTFTLSGLSKAPCCGGQSK